jgi:hypothetical protein
MKRKIAIILATVLLLSTCVVYAASINGTFAGLPIVNVNLNGEKLVTDVPGVVLQGKTLLPARAIAENLDAVVTWDQNTMTASIVKPEVQMVFVSSMNEDKDGYWDLYGPYSIESVGQDKVVTIYYEIGPMEKKVYDYRFICREPDGDILSSSTVDAYEIDETGMAGTYTYEDLDFKQSGKFTFELQIKYGNEYKTVGHKTLVVE